MQLHHGDCLDILPTLDAESVDSIVTDPPYGLSFMGKDWDHGVPGPRFWREALRVAKPGAHLLAFGGTRTFHRLACAIEDAGWEIRDTVMWVYGSGFPKSHNISKAIDKAAGAEREVVGVKPGHENFVGRDNHPLNGGWNRPWAKDPEAVERYHALTAPATDAARQWDGWGTSLKPAFEPVIVARKPIPGTVAENVLQHGTGGINVDACRVGTDGGTHKHDAPKHDSGGIYGDGLNGGGGKGREINAGRWPANVILSWPEDEYTLRDDVTPDELIELAGWLDENA